MDKQQCQRIWEQLIRRNAAMGNGTDDRNAIRGTVLRAEGIDEQVLPELVGQAMDQASETKDADYLEMRDNPEKEHRIDSVH